MVAGLIFLLRIIDVSIGTVRVIYTVKGNRLVAATLGFVESAVWIFAISRAFAYVDNPLSMAGWAFGYAAGTVLGITIDQWVASGSIIMRVISQEKPHDLHHMLLDKGFGVTAIPGEGRERNIKILFIVSPRKRGDELLKTVQAIDPRAFITIDPVNRAIGGYLPVSHTPAAGIRK